MGKLIDGNFTLFDIVYGVWKFYLAVFFSNILFFFIHVTEKITIILVVSF